MKIAKMTFVSTVVAAALGLALGLIGAPGNSYACHRGMIEHAARPVMTLALAVAEAEATPSAYP